MPYGDIEHKRELFHKLRGILTDDELVERLNLEDWQYRWFAGKGEYKRVRDEDEEWIEKNRLKSIKS